MEQKQEDGNLVACQNKIHYLSKILQILQHLVHNVHKEKRK